MRKGIFLILALNVVVCLQLSAQNKVDKRKKSRYFQNNTVTEDFPVKGFETDYNQRTDRENNEEKREYKEYDAEVPGYKQEGHYRNLKEIETTKTVLTSDKDPNKRRRRRTGRMVKEEEANNGRTRVAERDQEPKPRIISKKKVIYMTPDEHDYALTVVRKRYTSLDVLADDLDLAKWQRPVFKGICGECEKDVEGIIQDKTITNLEKNYRLKQSYMLRDKRLRETLEDGQYRKWLRIKDSDEYLILTRDPELIDGVYK